MRSLKTAVLGLAVVVSSVAVSSGQSFTSNNADGAGSAVDNAARLPVTRVILYKNGVGYFEHSGHVSGSQDVNVDFTTAQLNDVLKSLTVLDLGKGRITGVSYNSAAPLEHRLGSLRLPVGENPTTAQFLGALRGARLEVKSGSESASGRLLSIDEHEIPIKGDEKVTVEQLSIVSDSGEVRVFDLTPSTSVRVAEKEVNEEVGKYLGLVASTRDQDVRRMTISTAGSGERNLLVSYISEVPVWKSTYRIVIPSEGKPLLQGWAIVDNTVGEDWKNVELSLVAGAPQSFVQELSQPYYTRRPVVALPQNAMLTPQTHEATMEMDRLQHEGGRVVQALRSVSITDKRRSSSRMRSRLRSYRHRSVTGKPPKTSSCRVFDCSLRSRTISVFSDSYLTMIPVNLSNRIERGGGTTRPLRPYSLAGGTKYSRHCTASIICLSICVHSRPFLAWTDVKQIAVKEEAGPSRRWPDAAWEPG